LSDPLEMNPPDRHARANGHLRLGPNGDSHLRGNDVSVDGSCEISRASDHRHAAIDVQGLARDVACFVGGEIKHGGGNIFRRAHAT